MDQIKLCKDCKFFRKSFDLRFDSCYRTPNLTRGNYTITGYADIERGFDLVNTCGPNARYFQPKPKSLIQKFINWFKK